MISYPGHRWLVPPVVILQKNLTLQRSNYIEIKRKQKASEGSLHPLSEGQGIRDPLRSQSNKSDKSPFNQVSL